MPRRNGGPLKYLEQFDPPERDKVLHRLIAAYAIKYEFEEIYRTIFGSQLSALEFVNSSTAGAELKLLEIFFRQGVAQAPDFYEKYSFDQWLQFLTANQPLVEKNDQQVQITLYGREFLKYLYIAPLRDRTL